MVECNSVEGSNIYPNLNEISLSDQQHFRLNNIKGIKYYFIAEIKEREINVLSATSGSISIASFATVIGTPVGIASVSLSLTFSLSTGIVKKLLKTTRNKKKHNKIIMLARSKLNSIESKVSEALINSEISHEDFMIIINEEKSCRELKESIRMMNSQRSDAEKINLIEEGKKIGINEVIKRSEKYQILYKTMPSYCLKCKKNTESINPKVSKTANGKTMLLSKYAICGSKKSKFIKEQQTK